jgi:hypothetical protein
MSVEVAKGDAGVAVCMQGRKELMKERHIVGGAIRRRIYGAQNEEVKEGRCLMVQGRIWWSKGEGRGGRELCIY